jgi:hypothetical protein
MGRLMDLCAYHRTICRGDLRADSERVTTTCYELNQIVRSAAMVFFFEKVRLLLLKLQPHTEYS